MAMVALRCMGELLTQHPKFNFGNNLITAIVPYLNHDDDDLSYLAASFITKVFKTDKIGELSMEVSQSSSKSPCTSEHNQTVRSSLLVNCAYQTFF